MTLSNIEIVDAARLLYDEWRRQNARATVEDAALREKYGVTGFEVIGAEEGCEFTIGGVRYSASWYGELYYEHGYDLPEEPVAPWDLAAIAFADEFTSLIESYYAAVHVAAESLGWYWIEDDELTGIYFHDDADIVISVPHWCEKFGDITFLEAV